MICKSIVGFPIKLKSAIIKRQIPWDEIVNPSNLSVRLAGFLSAAVLAAGVLGGCTGGSGQTDSSRAIARDTIKGDAESAKDNLDKFKGVTLSGGKLSGNDSKGRPLWLVSAKTIRIFDEPEKDSAKTDGEKPDKLKAMTALAGSSKRAELTDATAQLFREGKPDTSFRSPRIILNQTEKGVRLTFSGGMTAQSQGSWTGSRGPVSISSPRAEVDVKTRRLWAGKGVRVVQGPANNRVHVIADQLRADTNLKTTLLSGGVKAGTNQGKFSARNANYNWQTGRASARGDISATHDKTIIKGARLEADTRAGRGVMSGGVTATGEQGNARAGSVRYDWKAHSLSAGGGVLLTKTDVTVQAGQIVTDDKFNAAVASGKVVLKKGDATLRANRVQTAGKGSTATASGGVVLTRGDATVSASSATANNIGEKSASIAASGDVRVARGDANVSASSATAYNVGENSAYVVASGDVRVKRGDMTLTAGRATASGLQDKKTLRVVASNGVNASSSDGSVQAGNATWGGGRVVASGGVTLLRDSHRLSGSRLVTNDTFTQATLSGDVNGRLAKGETLSAGILLYRKGFAIQGREGVSARRGELRLRADTMDATPDGNFIVLKGNVVVTNLDGATVRAPVVRYDRRAQKVFASGNVSLQDPKRGLKQNGRSLVADLQLKQVTLTDVTGSGKMDVFKDKKIF